jgi:hypothetical protein
MRLLLEIQTGSRAGESLELRTGQVAQVGRSSWADLSIPDDPALGDIHFLLEHGTSSGTLRDLNGPGGTYRNGARVVHAVLVDGDRIDAGGTTFAVRFAPDAPLPPPEDVASPTDRLLSTLRGQDEPLFALLDAARDLAVLAHLRGSQEPHQSLYEGEQGEELALFAPYLVGLSAASPLLAALVRHGWGRSWGVYLTSHGSFTEVRKHFRKFLMVRTERGDRLYFRFYDPRVLRVFLPTCSPAEAAEFFGPIGSFLVEGERPEIALQFTAGPLGAVATPMSLDSPA